jgi:hypothetical protein
MLQYKPSDFISDDIKTVSRPFIALFLETLADRRPELGDLARELAAAEERGGFSKTVSTLYAQAQSEPEKVRALIDAVAKINLLIDGVAAPAGFDNYLNVGRLWREKGYAESNGTGGKYHSHFIPNFIERYFLPPDKTRGMQDLQGGQERSFRFTSIRQFISSLNRTRKTEVLTPHPTEYKSREAKQIFRELQKAAAEITLPMRRRIENELRQLTSPSTSYFLLSAALEEAPEVAAPLRPLMERLVDAALTPMDDEARIRRLRVQDEIDSGVEDAGAARNNLRLAWHTFARVLERNPHLGTFDRAERLALNLHYAMHLWGGGDKDGHAAKTAEHTLYEKTEARRNGVDWLLQTLQSSPAVRGAITPHDYRKVVGRLTEARENLDAVHRELETGTTPKGDIALSQSEFDQVSDKLAFAIDPEGKDTGAFSRLAQNLQRQLEAAYLSRRGPHKAGEDDQLIDTIKALQNFGLHLAKAEHRERSNEIAATLGVIDPAYQAILAEQKKLTAEIEENKPPGTPFATSSLPDMHERQEGLQRKAIAYLNDKLLATPAHFAEAGATFLSQIDDTAAHRDYKKGGAPTVAYHNLKRTQELLKTPEMKGGMIIAECKGVQSVMEALALQAVFAPPRSEKAASQARIIPLFEEFETLKSAPDTMVDLFKQKAFRDHLLALAGGDIAKLDFEIMFAHSDNTKRAGTFASRAALLIAHHDCRAALAANWDAIKEAYAEDGHNVDAFNVNLHFYEGKSEGHFNRFGIRAPTAMNDAYGIHADRKGTVQGADGYKYHHEAMFKRDVTVDASHAAKSLAMQEAMGDVAPRPLGALARAVAEGFMQTEADYTAKHYSNGNGRGVHYAHPGVNYEAHARISVGSRPNARSGENEGSTVYMDIDRGTEAVKLKEIRAIPDAEMQYAGYIQATYFAAKNAERYVVENISGNPEALNELKRTAVKMYGEDVELFTSDNKLTTRAAHVLRLKDNGFREITDLLVYGCANTRYDLLREMLNEGEKKGIAVDPVHREYIKTTLSDYHAATEMVMKSFGYDMPELTSNNMYLAAEEMRQAILKGPLAHLQDEINGNWERAEPLIKVRADILMSAHAENRSLSDAEWETVRLCTAGWQPLSHGASLNARDPAYAEAHRTWIQGGRPVPQLPARQTHLAA